MTLPSKAETAALAVGLAATFAMLITVLHYVVQSGRADMPKREVRK